MTPQDEALHNILAPAYDLLGMSEVAVLTACGVPDAEALARGSIEGVRAKLAEPQHAYRLIQLFRAQAIQREQEAAAFRRAAEATGDALSQSLALQLMAAEQQQRTVEWIALQHVPKNARDN